MPSIFSRLKGKDGPTKIKSKKNAHLNNLTSQLPPKPRWDDAWTRQTVEPEEIHDLIKRCTEELKAIGMTSSPLALQAAVFLASIICSITWLEYGTC